VLQVYNEENVKNKIILEISQNTASIVKKFTLEMNFLSKEPNVTIQWMTLPSRILMVSVSNLGPETDYHDSSYS
jgi:hypothetical protein